MRSGIGAVSRDGPSSAAFVLRSSPPEGALDVDVPELVGPAPLVGRATRAVGAGPGRTQVAQECVDPVYEVDDGADRSV
jgi:hypothetical protein